MQKWAFVPQQWSLTRNCASRVCYMLFYRKFRSWWLCWTTIRSVRTTPSGRSWWGWTALGRSSGTGRTCWPVRGDPSLSGTRWNLTKTWTPSSNRNEAATCSFTSVTQGSALNVIQDYCVNYRKWLTKHIDKQVRDGNLSLFRESEQ